MAFEDSYLFRLKSLVANPKKNIRRIWPFVQSRINPYIIPILGRVVDKKMMSPYIGHDEFIKYFDYRNGFFMECGGHDGYGSSPTYYLEKMLGWRGIIAEPLSTFHLCKRYRSKSKVYNCAVGSFEQGKDTVSLVDLNAMSFISGSIEDPNSWVKSGESVQSVTAREIIVPIQPIQSLVDDYFSTYKMRPIDLFVVDVEGFEISVLKGLNFEKNPPSYILTEAHTDKRKDMIQKYLEEKNYELVTEIGKRDFLFKRKVS